MEREAGSGGAIALLLVVSALAAMAEVLAGRAVAPATPAPQATEMPGASIADAPRASSAEVLLRLGDEARRRGDAPAARRAYLVALFRARGEGSLTGVVEAAEGFAALGDDAVVQQALAMAEPLAAAAGADATARARLATLRERGEPSAALRAR